MKQVSLTDLLRYKASQQEGNQFLTLPSPEAVLTPAFAKLSSHVSSYNCYVQEPNRKAVDTTDSGEVAEKYMFADRVLVEAVLNTEDQVFGSDRYKTVVGFLYAHDVSKPIMKVYLGFENQACLNLSVFNAVDIAQRDFASTDFGAIYDVIDNYLQRIDTRREELVQAHALLTGEQLQGEQLERVIGQVALKAHKAIAMKTHFSQMMDLSFKPNGKYHKPDGVYTRYDLYQAMTYTIGKDREVSIARPDKVLDAYKFFTV